MSVQRNVTDITDRASRIAVWLATSVNGFKHKLQFRFYFNYTQVEFFSIRLAYGVILYDDYILSPKLLVAVRLYNGTLFTTVHGELQGMTCIYRTPGNFCVIEFIKSRLLQTLSVYCTLAYLFQ